MLLSNKQLFNNLISILNDNITQIKIEYLQNEKFNILPANKALIIGCFINIILK